MPRHLIPLLALLFLVSACGGGNQIANSPQMSGAQAPETMPVPEAEKSTAPQQPRVNQATFSLIESTQQDQITMVEVAYPSGDLTVRGFLFLPPGTSKHPAVVFNHGGVSGVSGDMKRRSRDLASLGYVVLAPSYRGEDGSDGVVEVAAGEVDDVLAGAAILAQHPRVLTDRMAITGTSHGALISMLGAAREPDRFRCVVAACGVMAVEDWYRYLVENDFDVSDSLSVAIYGTGPESKPEAFRVRNALLVADQITVPVLLQQGMRDTIVPPSQAQTMKRALIAAGKDVTLLEYPLLGHAFWGWTIDYHTAQEMDEAVVAWTDFTNFLAKHLGTE